MIKQLPKRWKFVKADLFDNASIEELKEGKRRLKLAFSIKLFDGNEWQYYRAAMNSPRKCYKRFVKEDWDWKHYNSVLKQYDLVKNQRGNGYVERVNISKCYKKGFAESKHTVEGLSAMLIQHTDGYAVILYADKYQIDLELDTHNLTKKQKSQGVIASGTQSNDTGYKRKSIKDIL